MSHVVWLELTDFRNFGQVRLELTGAGLTVISGENGAGKTSLLEAIGYSSTMMSFRGSPREALVRHGAQRALVRCEIEENGRRSLIEIEIDPLRRDQALLNRQRVTRSQQLLEVLRVTVFSPDDLVLVKGGPAERRRYLDAVLVACSSRYASTIQAVERILRQRAILLKQAGGRLSGETADTLDVWDAQLVNAGTELVLAREALVAELTPFARDAFSHLTDHPEDLTLSYERSFGEDLATALSSSRLEDLRRGVTTAGPHRDDLALYVGLLDARSRLSQGRQRALTLALRISSHELVTERRGTPPVLLLDDAFSELDETTSRALISGFPPGQAILTTAGGLPGGAAAIKVLRLLGGTLRE